MFLMLYLIFSLQIYKNSDIIVDHLVNCQSYKENNFMILFAMTKNVWTLYCMNKERQKKCFELY